MRSLPVTSMGLLFLTIVFTWPNSAPCHESDSAARADLSDAEVRRQATKHRDQWLAREKPAEADILQRGVIEFVEPTREGWHVAFVTRTGKDKPEGRHDYFFHIYLARDGSLLKVVRGPDRLS